MHQQSGPRVANGLRKVALALLFGVATVVLSLWGISRQSKHATDRSDPFTEQSELGPASEALAQSGVPADIEDLNLDEAEIAPRAEKAPDRSRPDPFGNELAGTDSTEALQPDTGAVRAAGFDAGNDDAPEVETADF